jgi:hypothetical protein
MKSESKFAARVFLGAGIYGILVLAPQYLVETGLGPALAAPITRPEQFYGFIGVALVWQFVLLLIARDVRRFRPLMLVGVLEKVSFGVPVLLLYARGRVGVDVLVFGCIDLLLGALFVLAYRATPTAERATTGA